MSMGGGKSSTAVHMAIPFNKPYLHGRELVYISQAVASGKISGDGVFSQKCHDFLEKRYGFHRALLTTSCTDALEMAAILLDIGPSDEVIVPSFTFVSTANAFALRGANIVFADSAPDHPNVDPSEIESLISERTKAIVPVHYSGVACDMDRIMSVAKDAGVAIVEDAAQAIESFYRGKPLGSLGSFGAFSFHETKNIIAGEGGLLSVNDPAHVARAEVIREKGTNRSAFFRGEVDKYGWVDIGSSFLPSDVIAAYLFAQLENLEVIQARRIEIWHRYQRQLSDIASIYGIELPRIPSWATNNGHMFYMVCETLAQRTKLIDGLKRRGVGAVFHYLPLHNSPYYGDRHNGRQLPNAIAFSERLVRLPLYYELSNDEVDFVCEAVQQSLK